MGKIFGQRPFMVNVSTISFLNSNAFFVACPSPLVPYRTNPQLKHHIALKKNCVQFSHQIHFHQLSAYPKCGDFRLLSLRSSNVIGRAGRSTKHSAQAIEPASPADKRWRGTTRVRACTTAE